MITLYSKPICPYCDGAEHYFKKNGFQYTKIDVTEDAEALAFIKSKGHKSVPQIYYRNRLLVEGGHDGLVRLLPSDLTHRIQQHDNGQDI